MEILEQLPSVSKLTTFTVAMLFVFVNAVIIAGHFPRRAQSLAVNISLCFIVISTLSLFASCTLLAVEDMPWFVIVIAAGLAFLFAPLIEQQLPISWRQSPPGLIGMSVSATALTVVTLNTLGSI